MAERASSITIHYKSIYLTILAFAILASTMPILGSIVFWVSIVLVFFCLLFFLFRIRSINKRYLFWVIAFCLFFSTSVLWALSTKLVAFVLIVRILPILIVTFSVSMYIKTIKDLYDILKVFYFVALFVLFYLLLFVDISSVEQRMSYEQLGEGWNTNFVGMQFVFAIYSGAILFWRKKISVKIAYLLTTSLMLYVVLITGSRKAIIMFFIPLIYFILFNKQIKLSVKLVLLFFGLGGLYVLFSIPMFYNIAGKRIMDMITMLGGDYTTGGIDNSRIFLTLYGWEWFQDRIWLGYGINNYRFLSDATSMFAGKNFYAHNNYIELLVGVGIIGTFIYYYGYYYVMRKAIKQRSQYTHWVIALFLTLLFIDVAQVTYYGMIFLLFICIGFSAVSLKWDYKSN